MGYRNELDAAKARIEHLERENGELRERAPSDTDLPKKIVAFGCLAVGIALVIGVCAFVMAGEEGREAHRTALRLRQQIEALRSEAAALRSGVADLQARRETLHSQVAEAEDRLGGLTASITAAETHLRAAREPVAPSASRPRGLTEPELAARLALCRTGGTAEHPYTEGVVARIERRMSLGTSLSGRWVRPSFRATVRVPEQDVLIEPHYYSTREDQIMDMLFWSRVEVGDIVGLTIHDGQVTAIVLTDK